MALEFDVIHQQRRTYSTKDKKWTWKCTCGKVGESEGIRSVQVEMDTHNDTEHGGTNAY